MKNPPKISIVTPSFNQGIFLEETIRSVISQQGDFSIDYVIVDGGSNDNSLEIIKKYDGLIKKNAWPVQCRGLQYRWLSGPDKGQSDAINKGARMAEGDILAWLNSDDYYLPGAFAGAARAFQDDETLAMVYGDGEVVDREGRLNGQYGVEPLFDLWKLIHLYDFILQPSVFMRSEAFKSAGQLKEELHYIMDWELWIKLSRFGKIRHLPEKVSCSRVYPEAKTQASGIKRWKEIRWCSKKYGHMKWPPVVFTQLLHKPVNVLRGAGGGQGLAPAALLEALRKVYYRLIRGNSSGIHADGCVERTGFLSIPLRREVAKAALRLGPLCSVTLQYFINNRYSGSLLLKGEMTTLEVVITDEMKKTDFLHIKFISGKETASGTSGKAAFRIKDISLKTEDGSEVRDIGLPEFRE